MKGQVTIEFILVIVVMLAILATISLPTVERIEQDVTDTGTAINLAAIQQRIVNTAEELSMTGCGSHKTITVFVSQDNSEGKVTWDSTVIGGSYFQLNTDPKNLKNIPFADYIDLDSADTLPVGDGYWDVTVTKDCNNNQRPSGSGCVGFGC